MTEKAVYLPDDVYTAVRWRAREMNAFERLRPELLKQYPGQYVGIYQERVVGTGEDQFALLKQVYAEFGQVICYIDKPDRSLIRKARIPSTWIVRERLLMIRNLIPLR
jgi:hypothetical protein